MTTIAYDHKNKMIAWDGRCTSNRRILSDESIKHAKHGDSIYVFTAANDDGELLARAHYEKKDLSEFKSLNASCYVMKLKEPLRCISMPDDGVIEEWTVDYTDSMGSGSAFALAALDFGKSAKEAVEYAATRDTCTGGKITVFDVESMEFL